MDSFQVLGQTIQSFLSQLKRAKVRCQDLMIFFTTCIHPLLTYAYEVYNFNLQEKQKSSLERIQKRAMRIIDGFDTPFEVALESSSIVKLSLKLCDDFLSMISSNTKDKLFEYLPFNTKTNLPLRNIRKFLILDVILTALEILLTKSIQYVNC